MKPVTVINITIHGKERNAAQYLADLQRDTYRLHIRDYQRAGVTLPEVVREKARTLGIEVEPS